MKKMRKIDSYLNNTCCFVLFTAKINGEMYLFCLSEVSLVLGYWKKGKTRRSLGRKDCTTCLDLTYDWLEWNEKRKEYSSWKKVSECVGFFLRTSSIYGDKYAVYAHFLTFHGAYTANRCGKNRGVTRSKRRPLLRHIRHRGASQRGTGMARIPEIPFINVPRGTMLRDQAVDGEV